jgi:hypothetical protein
MFGPHLGDLLGILSHNPINSKSLFVVAGIFPFSIQLSALFAASKQKTKDQYEQTPVCFICGLIRSGDLMFKGK